MQLLLRRRAQSGPAPGLKAPLFPRGFLGRRAVRAKGHEGNYELKPVVPIGRSMEAEQLLTMCCEDPTGVTVVVGEPRCGKSTLFRYLFGQASYPGIYINTHTFLPSDTGALVTALREQFKRFPGLTRDAEQILDSGRPILKIHVSVAGTGMTVERAAGVSDVTIAMRLLAQFLKRYWEQKGPKAPKPVIVFDEAQRWQSWASEERTALLQYLLQVTKVDKLAVVYLLTNENSFVDSIKAELPSKHVEVLHLGNLNRDNATEYMLHKAQQLGLSSPEDAQERADLMEQIFGACGGNAGLMNLLVTHYVRTRSWDDALGDVLATSKAGIDAALGMGGVSPCSDTAFTPQQFAKVALLLLDSRTGSIGLGQAQELLGRDALTSMINSNLLSVRPYSPLAQDIHKADHPVLRVGGIVLREELVVPASSSHLAAMRLHQGLIRSLASS